MAFTPWTSIRQTRLPQLAFPSVHKSPPNSGPVQNAPRFHLLAGDAMSLRPETWRPSRCSPLCKRIFLAGTRSLAITHLKNTSECLAAMRHLFPNGGVHGAEVAKGAELAMRDKREAYRLPGPELAPAPAGAAMPPAPPGHLTPEEVNKFEDEQEEDPPDRNEGTVSAMSQNPARCTLHDITPYLGPIRVAFLFYGGGRRDGDVAHFLEIHAPSFRPLVVNWSSASLISITAQHTTFHAGQQQFWDSHMRAGRVAVFGAALPRETSSIARWAKMGWHERAKPVPLRCITLLWGRTILTDKCVKQTFC